MDAATSRPKDEVHRRVEQHLHVVAGLLAERQAPKAFGELVRASRTLPMTRRLASAIVTVSLRAGTEAAAITVLASVLDKVDRAMLRYVSRQLARVLRRVDQFSRAIETLEQLLVAYPDDHSSRRVLQALLERTGRWEALVASLEREAQEAFQAGEYGRAARATRWRARVQAEQMRNLARASESYGQAANYLEKMGDADGAFAVRLDGLRVLHASGASEAVLTAASSVCMSAAARLGRDAQARQVLEELGLIPGRIEPEQRVPRPAATVEMALPLLQAMLAASLSGQDMGAGPAPKPVGAPPPEPVAAPAEPVEAVAQASLEAEAVAEPAPKPVEAEAAAEPVSEPAEAKAANDAEGEAEASPEPAEAKATANDAAVEAEANPEPAEAAAEPGPEHIEAEAVAAPVPESAEAEAAAEPVAESAKTEAAAGPVSEPVAAEAAAEPVPEPEKAEPAATAAEASPEPIAAEAIAEASSEAPEAEASPGPVEPEAAASPDEAEAAVGAESSESDTAAEPSSAPAEAEAAASVEAAAADESSPELAEADTASEPSPEPAEAARPQAEDAAAEFAAPPTDGEQEPPEEEQPEAVAAPEDDSDDIVAPDDVRQEEAGLKAAEGLPLTELLEIPDEGGSHTRPPVDTGKIPVEAQERREQDSKPEEPPPTADEPWEDPAAQQHQEAQLIARKAWPELAQFYLASADRAKEPQLRAEVLTRLAELMEDELGDPTGAARVYREIVALTGDRDALKHQLRLLSQRGDPDLVRRALDEAVQTARTPKARAAAHLTRAERALEAGERSQAKADFETVEALTPGMLLVLAGLVRCVPGSERALMANRLRSALTAVPRGAPDRLEALRTLASVAQDSLKDARLAQWAWTEVLAEDPEELRARERLLVLARTQGDKAALTQLLRGQLAIEPRGREARLAWMELVSALDDAGQADEALAELRQAVRFEPGHKEAWLLLADRLTERGQIGEAAWALENAASAMEDDAERQRAWVRLASFCHNVLKDPVRAEMYSRRAENLRLALQVKSAPPVPDLPQSPAPVREGRPRAQVLTAPPRGVDLTPLGELLPPGGDDPSAIITDPALVLPDHARPTIEFAAVPGSGAPSPFSDDEEITATEAPEGFVPPGASEPAPPPPVKAARPASTPNKKSAGKKPRREPLDASRELDSLLGEDQEEPDNTSPFLSAWSMKRPPAPAARPQKASAPAQPPAARARKAPMEQAPAEQVVVEKAPPGKVEKPPSVKVAVEKSPAAREPGEDTSEKSTARMRKVRPKHEEHAPPPSPFTATRKAPSESPSSEAAPKEQEDPASLSGERVQNTSIISWEAPPGRMEPVRRLARAREAPAASKAPPPEPAGTEPAAFKKVRERPLDAALYREIAAYFDSRGDAQRADLMREIAHALEGKEGPAPRAPSQTLAKEERSGLRHPQLRTPAGDLLKYVGVALCRLYPVHGRAAGTDDRLRPNLGPGAPLAIDALGATERLLGIEASEAVLSEENGPPFSLVFTSAPRLLVGRQAVRQVLPAPELRFYAGRALLCLEPDLLALRSLKKDQILRGMALLASVLKDKNVSGLEARVLRESLTPKQFEKAVALYGPASRQFDVTALADAARDSANRAGLIACGSVGPALVALRMKRALEREVAELVRFAASERYFQLRTTH